MSLVTTRASQLRSCTTCASNRVTEIDMTLTDGSSVDFVSCHACESRSWTQAGRALDISTVLTKATKPRPGSAAA